MIAKVRVTCSGGGVAHIVVSGSLGFVPGGKCGGPLAPGPDVTKWSGSNTQSIPADGKPKTFYLPPGQTPKFTEFGTWYVHSSTYQSGTRIATAYKGNVTGATCSAVAS